MKLRSGQHVECLGALWRQTEKDAPSTFRRRTSPWRSSLRRRQVLITEEVPSIAAVFGWQHDTGVRLRIGRLRRGDCLSERRHSLRVARGDSEKSGRVRIAGWGGVGRQGHEHRPELQVSDSTVRSSCTCCRECRGRSRDDDRQEHNYGSSGSDAWPRQPKRTACPIRHAYRTSIGCHACRRRRQVMIVLGACQSPR